MRTASTFNGQRSGVCGRQKLCLFGVGEQLNDCYDQLVLLLRRPPDFLCDNAVEKWGKKYFGVKCLPPSELSKFRSDLLVIITIRSFEGPYRQLLEMGIKNISVCCYDRSYDRIRVLKQLEADRLNTSAPVPPMISVEGKWALITGASRGVGRQIAIAMARLGSNIIAHSRSAPNTDEIQEKCRELGVQFVAVQADFGRMVEVDRLLRDLKTLVPQVDIVFNNAAVGIPCPAGFWSMPVQDFICSFTINTVAPIRICQSLIPEMITRGFGRVINISSTIHRRPGEMAYACSKAALDKFVHDLAPSLHGTGVMISLVNPGWLRTDMGGSSAPHSVASVVPGALLGAVLDRDVNGRWFGAQDYAGLSLETAMQRAAFYMF